jgi:hypothetical protein
MLKVNISYRKKVRILPWIAGVVCIMVYWLAVSETLKLKKEMHSMEKEMLAIENAPDRLNQLRSRLNEINRISGNSSGEMVTDPLLELSSKQALDNAVILSEYQPVHVFSYGNHQVETRIISFEAPFIPCLKVLNSIERLYRYGKIVSVNYSAKTDYKTSTKHLSMQILIQTIQNENNVKKTSEQ